MEVSPIDIPLFIPLKAIITAFGNIFAEKWLLLAGFLIVRFTGDYVLDFFAAFIDGATPEADWDNDVRNFRSSDYYNSDGTRKPRQAKSSIYSKRQNREDLRELKNYIEGYSSNKEELRGGRDIVRR